MTSFFGNGPGPGQAVEFARQAFAADGEIHHLQHALAAEVIDDIEDTEAAAVGQLIRDEID